MEIRDNVATKRFRMVFHNPNSAPNAEATFFMDLEPDQKVDRFSVKVGGKPAEGEILDAEKARKVYEDIVRKKKDPALLEYYGSKLLRIRIFPLPPRSDFEVEIETLEPLRAQDGVVRVQTLNASPASFQKPIGRVTIEATISSSRAVKSVFSPTHSVDVVRKDAHEARMTYDKRDYVPNGPFTFYYTLGDDQIGATMIATPDGEDGGVFMLTLTPPSEVKDDELPPRNVLFLLDTSGSMNEDGKIEQARAALKTFVGTLRDKDRFDIVTFGTEARNYSGQAPHATEKARADAVAWIDAIRARGGTNIEEALQTAKDIYIRGGSTSVVFVSDGIPTIGERDPRKLVALAKSIGGRVFCFGVGADVQSQLLDRLAIETGGDRQYVAPREQLALVVENFARRIGAPVVVNPSLKFDGSVSEVQPRRLPDLFRGGELTVYGRYRGAPPRTVELNGWGNGVRVHRVYETAVAPDARHAFVARLWAIQTIDFLIDEIRERGASKELVDHIVEIAKRYGIVTPYTSSLMTEDTPTAQVLNQLKSSQTAGFTGAEDNRRVGNQMAWRNAGNHEAQLYACNGALGRGTDAQAVAQTLQQQRYVCNRAFNNGKAGWAETSFAAQKVQSLRFGSDEYFQFVRDNPETAPILALGNNVTFQHRNCWYRIEA